MKQVKISEDKMQNGCKVVISSIIADFRHFQGFIQPPQWGSTPLLKNSIPLNQAPALLTPPGVVYHKICALSERLRTVT